MTCDPADVVANQKQMQIMNWFCSDMHVRGEYPYYMKRFFAEHNITIHQEPEDAAYGHGAGVDLVEGEPVLDFVLVALEDGFAVVHVEVD